MYISTKSLSSILDMDRYELEMELISHNLRLIANKDGSSATYIADAIRYIHSDPSIIQKVEAYQPENAYMKNLQDSLLCRCSL